MKNFNDEISRIGDSDLSRASRLKEKREYFIDDVYGVDCDKVQKMSQEIDNGSDILNGKTWGEILQDEFQQELNLGGPPIKEINSAGWDAIIKDLDKAYENIHKGLVSEIAEEVVKTLAEQPPIQVSQSCTHDWFVYHGLGTKPSETICLKCGSQKPNKVAP